MADLCCHTAKTNTLKYNVLQQQQQKNRFIFIHSLYTFTYYKFATNHFINTPSEENIIKSNTQNNKNIFCLNIYIFANWKI